MTNLKDIGSVMTLRSLDYQKVLKFLSGNGYGTQIWAVGSEKEINSQLWENVVTLF